MRQTLLGALLLLFAPHASAKAVQQSSRPDSVTESRRGDLKVFRTEFFARDNSYSVSARAEAERQLARLEILAAELSAVKFDLGLARIVALADNGHTVMFASTRARKYNRIPVRLTPLDGGFYVLRAALAHRDLLGARLVAVDDHTVTEVVDSARTLVGGTQAFRDRSVSFFLESPEQMHALGLTAIAGSAHYRFDLPNGRVIERELTAEPPSLSRDGSGSRRFLYPEPLIGAASHWVSLMDTSRVAWAYRDVRTPFRWRVVPELSAMVIEFRQNNDAPGRPIREFTVAMMDSLRALKPTNVVIDMRVNGGGDLNTTRGFFTILPRLVPGRIFVLTSPWTFSAAISSVGYLKQEAPDRVTIVGEEVGDRLEFWAEGRVVRLPATGNQVLYATERHDYRNGCKEFTDCHDSVVRHPIAVPSLVPDVHAPLTLEDYVVGRDPAMAAIAKLLGRTS